MARISIRRWGEIPDKKGCFGLALDFVVLRLVVFDFFDVRRGIITPETCLIYVHAMDYSIAAQTPII
jgi:hypothetical protein